MFRRYHLFDLAGFPLYAEPTFLLLAGFYLLTGGLQSQQIVASLSFVVAVALSILWHELGHAVAARRLGASGISIVLHGAGGLTYHSPLATRRRSVLVAAAGPAAGLALGLPLAAAWWFTRQALPGLAATFLWDLVYINVLWSLFNLLPMLPLDGGHILQDVLVLRLGSLRGRELAWAISFFLAVGVGLVGLWQRWFFITMICLFSGQLVWKQMRGPGPLKRFWHNLTAPRRSGRRW